MKSLNPGHELDDTTKIIKNYFLKKQCVFAIFGAGRIGKEAFEYIEHFGSVKCFIDNNDENPKYSNGYMGCRVLSIEKFRRFEENLPIIIAASEDNTIEIISQLNKLGLKNVEYCSIAELKQYVPIYMAYYHSKTYMEIAQICITERCTLRCKKCAHGCYAVSRDVSDMPLEDVMYNADAFFSKVDYINEFVLIGGEPTLHKGLAECVNYIGEHYRDRINVFSITTNGTRLPDEATTEACRRHNVTFRISNYSGTIPQLHDQYEKLKNYLENNHIRYSIGKAENEWFDYGFDEELNEVSEAELINRFDRCKTPCRDVHNGRLYFCVMARSVSDNLGYHIGEEDYLDLRSLPNGRDGAIEMLEFNQGYSEKGYLDMCARCRGAESRNYLIPAAEQAGN